MSDPWPAPDQTLPGPGWFPDPYGSPGFRYWDGARWTAFQAAPEKLRDEFRTLPIRAAWTAIIVTIASLTASRYVVQWLADYRWPIAAYVLIAAVLGYGPLLVCCRMVVDRWGTGNLGDDLGFRVRKADLGWGPLTWVASFIAQIVVAVIVFVLDIPIVSNTEGVSRLTGNRAYVISFAFLAVVCAPIVEELIFRGVILRGFRSCFSAGWSIALQGVIFGCAHIDPVRGLGNIGLAMVLSAVGIVLGVSAYLLRRLGPTMIAHAMTNTLAFIIILTR